MRTFEATGLPAERVLDLLKSVGRCGFLEGESYAVHQVLHVGGYESHSTTTVFLKPQPVNLNTTAGAIRVYAPCNLEALLQGIEELQGL